MAQTSTPSVRQINPPREPVWMMASPVTAATGQVMIFGRRVRSVTVPTDKMIALRFAFWPKAVMRSPPVQT